MLMGKRRSSVERDEQIHRFKALEKICKVFANTSVGSPKRSPMDEPSATITAAKPVRRFPRVRVFLGIYRSPSSAEEPEGSGCGERFTRTLKVNLRWVRAFKTIEERRLALLEFKKTYNEQMDHPMRCLQIPSTSPPGEAGFEQTSRLSSIKTLASYPRRIQLIHREILSGIRPDRFCHLNLDQIFSRGRLDRFSHKSWLNISDEGQK